MNGYSFVTDQWIRKWGIVVYNLGANSTAIVLSMGSDDPGAEQLKVKFYIKQTDGITPNNAVIRIYNISEQTVNSVIHEYTRVTVQAGYRTGKYGVVFDGWMKMFRYGKESPTDSYLEIYAADGDVAFNHATVNTTLMPGANTPQDQWNAASKEMETYGTGGSSASGQTLQGGPIQPRPTVLYGMSRDEMSQISLANRKTWSIQNGTLQLTDNHIAKPGEGIVINVNTGQIGFPEVTNDGVHVRCLLNPSIHVREQVELNNAEINAVAGGVDSKAGFAVWPGPGIGPILTPLSADGLYVALVVEHQGDSRGNEWYTDIICWAMNKDKQLIQQDGTFPSKFNPANLTPGT